MLPGYNPHLQTPPTATTWKACRVARLHARPSALGTFPQTRKTSRTPIIDNYAQSPVHSVHLRLATPDSPIPPHTCANNHIDALNNWAHLGRTPLFSSVREDTSRTARRHAFASVA